MAGLAAEADRTQTPTAKLQRELGRAAAQVEKLSKQQNRQQVELQKTSASLRAAGVDTEKLADASDRLQGELLGVAQRGEAVAGSARKAGKDTRAAAGGVGTLDKAAGGSAKSLGALALRLTAISTAVTVALKGLATLSGTTLFAGGVRSATDLEDALTEVKAVTGATAEELAAMKQAAEAGGAATRFSALEAAQGLGELARATGSAQTAIAALPATLDLAQAAGLGVAQAAEIVTTTLTQYGLAADNAGRVSDVLAMAANATTADVEGLGNALSYAAPLAKLLGIDLETTVAILGALADQGFRGERAGTALRNVFSEMLDPASDFGRALREAGIESSDFIEVVEQLGKKGQEGQEALLKLDAAARPAILSLVNSGSAALRQLDGDLRNAAGSANETAQTMGNSLSGAAEQIRDTFDQTRRSLVEPLLEPLRNELVALAGELEEFAQSPEFAELKVALQETFIEGAAAARELFEEIDFHQLARSIREALDDAGDTIDGFKDQLEIIVGAVTLIGQTFAVVFNAVQTAILGIAAAVAKIASVFFQVQDALTGPARAILEFFGIIEEGQGSVEHLAGGLGAVADEFGGRMLTNMGETADAAKRLGGSMTDAGSDAESGIGKLSAAATDLAGAEQELEGAAEGATAALTAQGSAATATATVVDAAAEKAKAAGLKLRNAYADLGIESQADLQRTAAAARTSFEIVREAFGRGEASIEDVRRALERYSSTARAAVAESEPAAKARVEAELAVLEAIFDVNDALDEQVGKYRGLGGAAESAAKATGRVDESSQKAGSSMQKSSGAAQGLKVALQGMSDAAVQTLFSLNRLAGTQLWLPAWNRQMARIEEQRAALARVNDELDKQLAKMDPLEDRMEKLRAQYSLLDAEAVRALAQKQERVDQELKRKREEALQERQRILDEARGEADQATGGAATATRAAIGSRLVTIRVELPTGSEEFETTPEGVEATQRILDTLARSAASSQLRRRT
nr:phage tail tape measure protein [Luteimonas saliphila]